MPEGQELIAAIAVEVAKELSKSTYEDGLSPAVRQTGSVFEDIVKTLHLALAPIQFTAALQDRYRRFLDDAVRRVPEPNRIPPPKQILGPVIEGIKYETEGSEIETMFSELLSSSMDSTKSGYAHPALPTIIRQMSTDEARLVQYLGTHPGPARRVVIHLYENRVEQFHSVELESFPTSDLLFPNNIQFYLAHLSSLGLLVIREKKQEEVAYFPPDKRVAQSGFRTFIDYWLTDLGRILVQAALPDD